MRHYKKGRKLGTSKSHTKAMKRGLVCSLFLNDRIKTLEPRAKEIRGDVDKIITWAKRGDLHSRRLAIAALGGDKYLVQEIFEKVSQGMFKERNSGYTRIIKLGARKGDNAPMVIIELINEGKKRQKPSDEKKSAGRKLINRNNSKKADDNKEESDKQEKLNSDKADVKEEKPEQKSEENKEDSNKEKTEEKKEEKSEDKSEDKPEDKPEEKSEEKPEDKPEKNDKDKE